MVAQFKMDLQAKDLLVEFFMHKNFEGHPEEQKDQCV